jgi:uncharacterized membrane protein HdeD (DUF308 family)
MTPVVTSAASPDAAPMPQRTLAVRGALLLVFGLCQGGLLLLAFRLPNITSALLTSMMMGFVILDGLAIALETGRAIAGGRSWLVLAAKAVVGIGAGIWIAWLASVEAITVFAWWALLIGLLETLEAASAGRHHRWRWLVAFCSIAFGGFVLGGPVSSAPVLLLVTAVYGVVVGAFRLRAALG